MGYKVNRLGRVAIKAQGSGWGTAETTFASTTYVEAEVFVPPWKHESHRTDPLRSGFEEPEVLPGSKAGIDVSLKFPLHGHSAATPSADASVHPDALLMQMALGAAVQTGYTATNIASGGTTSSVKFTAASTNWEGSAILIPVTTAAVYELFWAKDVDTSGTPDTSTVLATLQRTPASSGTHYGSNTCYLSNATPTPITLDFIGTEAGAHVRYSDGLVKSVKVTCGARKNPMCEAVIHFTGTPTFPGSGGSLAAYAYDFPLVPVAIQANGAAGYFNSAWDTISETTFSVDCTLNEVDGYGSAEGVAQMVVADRKVTATVIIPCDGTYTADVLEPGTSIGKLEVLYATVTPGRAAGFCIPSPTLVSATQLVDRSGVLAVQYEIAAQVYSGDGGAGAGAGQTAVRFSFA